MYSACLRNKKESRGIERLKDEKNTTQDDVGGFRSHAADDVLSDAGVCRGRGGRVCALHVCVLLVADPAGGGDRAGADHKGSIQFPVCRDSDRRRVLLRIYV